MRKLTLILFLCLAFSLFLFPVVSAERTVKTLEIPLGYSELPLAGQIQYYNLSVDYPDGISRVIAMEVMVKGDYAAGTTTYGGFLYNDVPVFCEPDSWTIYQASNNYEMSFDCTSLLQGVNWQGGDLTFIIMSDTVSANVKPYVKVTYENEPTYDAQVYGTEYKAGDEGKVFLQLLDSDFSPIENSSCFSSIYYPNGDIFKFQQKMNYVGEGIYDYDFDVPFQLGVYPVSAFCTVPELNITQKIVTDDMEDGISGGSGWLTNWTLNGCDYTGPAQGGSLSLDCEDDDTPTRNVSSNSNYTTVDYSFYWRGNELEVGEIVYVRMKDASGTVYTLVSFTDGDDDGLFNLETGTLSEEFDGFDFDGTVEFYMETSGNLEATDYFNLDTVELDFNGEFETNDTEYQVVRGTGEVHVNPGDTGGEYTLDLLRGELTNKSFDDDFTFVYQVTSQTSANKTEQDLMFELYIPFPCAYVYNVTDWTSGSPVLYNFTGETDDLGRCTVNIEHGLNVSETYDIRILTQNYWKTELNEEYSTALLEEEMINISCQNYVRANNLTNFTIPLTEVPYGQDNFWLSCATYLDAVNDYKNLVAGFQPLLNINANFTEADMDTLEANWVTLLKQKEKLEGYANTIFNGLNLGGTYSLGLISDPFPPTNPLYATYFASISTGYLNYLQILGVPTTVWNFANRTLTAFDFEVNATAEINVTEITEAVWTYSDRQLTTFTFTVDTTNNNLTAQDVWTYVNRSLTEFGFEVDATVNTTEIASDVWSFPDRELTSFSFAVDTTDVNLTAEDIWTYMNRSLTEFNFIVNVNTTAIADAVWSSSNRQLTDFTFTVDTTNNNLTAEDVWTYVNRSLTEFGFTVDTTNVDLTAADVWSYTERNLTSFDFTVDTTNNNLTAQDIWEYVNRSLTEFSFTVDTTVNSTEIADAVWNSTNRQLTDFAFTVDTTNNNLTAEDVWTYVNRSLTEFGFTVDTTVNVTEIADAVWNSADRQLTDFTFTVDTTNENLTAQEVWEYVNRSLTEFPFTVDTNINISEISQEVWNYSDRELTDFSFTVDTTNENLTAQEVWEYVNRSLTEFSFTVDTTNNNLTAFDVWNYTLRELTDFSFTVDTTNNNITAEDIWTYANRSLTEFNFIVQVNTTAISDAVWSNTDRQLTDFAFTVDTTDVNLTAEEVWEYVNRSLTEFNFEVDTTVNLSGIASDVWNFSDRELTGFSFVVDTTNNNLTAEDIWTYVNRSLTEFAFTVDTTVNSTEIANAVWTSSDRQLTDFSFTVDTTNNNLTAQEVWEYVNRSLTEFNFNVDATVNTTAIADAVWSSADRQLTDFSFTVDTTNNNLTSQDIWTYVNRSLTEFPFTVDTNINISEISQEVWNYTDRELTEFSFTVDTDLNNLTAEDIWTYVNRSLTEFSFTVDTTNVDLTAFDVWNYSLRELTGFTFTVDTTDDNLTAEDIWTYNNRSLSEFNFVVEANVNLTAIADAVWSSTDRQLTDFAFTVDTTNNNLTAQQIWEYVNRSLTEFNFEVETTVNVSEISQEVWNYSDRELTSFSFVVDTTNNNLTSEDIWTYVNRSLTEFAFTVETTVNATEIANAVWTSSDRQLTDFSFTVDTTNTNLTAEDIWTYVNRSLTEFNFEVETTVNVSEISQEVWNYSDRELTSFSFTVDTTNNNLTAQDIWTYLNRSLTEFNFEVDATVNNTALANEVWTSSNRSLTNSQIYNIVLNSSSVTNSSYINNFTFFFDVSPVNQNLTSQEVEIVLPKPFACEYILSVGERLDDGNYTNLSYEYSTDENGFCQVNTTLDLTLGQNSRIEVVSENQWKRIYNYEYATALLEAEMINITCQNYITENNLPNLTLPFTQSPEDVYNQTDAFWLSCAGYFDEYQNYLDVRTTFSALADSNSNLSVQETLEFEADWIEMSEILKRLDSYSQTIFSSLSLTNSHGLYILNDTSGPSNPYYATYMSNESSNTIIYEAITGTTFDFSITVGNTFTDTAVVVGQGITGDGRVLNRDVTISCVVDGYPETFKQFETFVTDEFSFTEEITNIPNIYQVYTMKCNLTDFTQVVEAEANFRRLAPVDDEGSGGIRNITVIEQIIDDIRTEEVGESKVTETIFWVSICLIIVAIVFCIWWFLICGREERKRRMRNFRRK